jgi:hypothetical protein
METTPEIDRSQGLQSIYFKSERLSASIELTFHKALIRAIMTDASPTWEFAADIHLLKFQRLQNKVPRTIGNFPKHTSVRELLKASIFRIFTII